MKKLKLISLLVVACLLAVTLSATVQAQPQPQLDSELYVYNWGSYMDEDLLGEYEQQYGVRITFDTFASLEEMFAKLQAGAVYDVIFPSDWMVARLIELGLLARIDKNNVPNLEYLDPTSADTWYDPGPEYCVPYMWGSTGIAYMVTLDRVPDGWGAFFDPEQASYYAEMGGINVLDDQREVISAALFYLGYSANETDPEHLYEARDLIIESLPNFRYFNSADYQETLLIPGEVVLSHSWDGSTINAALATISDEHPEGLWKHVVPKEGAIRYQESMCVPANSPRKATAEHFINFIFSPENMARNSNATGYLNANTASTEFLLPELQGLLPPRELLEKMEFMKPLDEETMRIYDQIWTEIRISQ